MLCYLFGTFHYLNYSFRCKFRRMSDHHTYIATSAMCKLNSHPIKITPELDTLDINV